MIEHFSDDPAAKIITDALNYVAQHPSQDIHIALTGGRAGQVITRELTSALHDNKFVHFWWSDERFVPADDAERTTRDLPPSDAKCHFHIPQDPSQAANAQTSAAAYASTLHQFTTTRFCADNTMMDICILSVGPDGHIASLFPHHPELDSVAAVVAILDSPKPPAQRTTWTYPTINASRNVWLIATGAEKREAIEALRREADFHDYPAAGAHGKIETRLYTDIPK